MAKVEKVENKEQKIEKSSKKINKSSYSKKKKVKKIFLTELHTFNQLSITQLFQLQIQMVM